MQTNASKGKGYIIKITKIHWTDYLIANLLITCIFDVIRSKRILTENYELIKEQVKYTWQKYINIFLEKSKQFSFLAAEISFTCCKR